MKNFLLALLPNLTTKAAVTAAVCVTAGAAASGAVSTAVYTHKTAEYRETIQQLEEEVAQTPVSGGAGAAKKAAGDGSQQATAVRVVDGILEVWDGGEWVDYGSVDDVRSEDPFYENADRRAEVEQSVAAKKLDELGLEINEEGEIVKKEPVSGADPAVTDTTQPDAGKKDTIILIGSTAGSGSNSSNSNNNTGKTSKSSKATVAAATPASTAGLTPEQVMAAIQAGGIAPGATTLSTSPTAGVTNVSWTPQSSSGGGGGSSDNGGGGGGGSSDNGGGGGGGSSPAPQPSQPSQPAEEHHEESHSDPAPEPSVSEGGGGGDWGGDVE